MRSLEIVKETREDILSRRDDIDWVNGCLNELDPVVTELIVGLRGVKEGEFGGGACGGCEWFSA